MSETQNPVKFNIRRRTPAPHRKVVSVFFKNAFSSGHVRQPSETPHLQLFDAGIPVDLARSWMQRRPRLTVSDKFRNKFVVNAEFQVFPLSTIPQPLLNGVKNHICISKSMNLPSGLKRSGDSRISQPYPAVKAHYTRCEECRLRAETAGSRTSLEHHFLTRLPSLQSPTLIPATGPGLNYIITRDLVADVAAYELGFIKYPTLLARREIKLGEC
ncbi:hypothetical protein B0H14DRAFT_2570649 [Mycena olivaceomarginata]|nr:hypothetical protein B0H14DRAFT_2570649 [Mycena olivaceomarginata]